MISLGSYFSTVKRPILYTVDFHSSLILRILIRVRNDEELHVIMCTGRL